MMMVVMPKKAVGMRMPMLVPDVMTMVMRFFVVVVAICTMLMSFMF